MQASARLLGWRRRRKLQQKEAADAAGLSQSAWSLIERGEKTPSLVQAFRIQSVTGGTVKASDWLSDGEPTARTMRRTGS